MGAGELRAEARDPAQHRRAFRAFLAGAGITIVLTVIFALLLRTGAVGFDLDRAAQVMGVVIGGFAVIYFFILLAFGRLTSLEKKRVLVIFLLFIGAALFWSGFEQGGSSLTLFAERLTDRVLLGWEMPASWLQAVNPMFIILFAPVFGVMWVSLAARAPSIPAKFGLGLLLLGVGFAVMSWGSTYASESSPVGLGWLISTYFLHTLGELCLSPVGLSSVTKLSPPKLTGQMMGIWFMGAALGNLMAGILGGRFESLPLPGLFGSIAAITAGAGLLFLIFSRPVDRMAGGVR
jgi:POT family proton-dependent oligopeptide transporter